MADKKIKFVNITKTDSGNFVNLVNLARARKINSDTIVKVVGYSDRLVLEVWRREGGIDMFHTPTNDVFDKITIKGMVEYPENPLANRVNFNLCFESFPVGFLSEDELEKINGTLLISNSVLNEKDLSSVVIDIINRYSNFGIYTISFGVNLNKYQKEINDMRYDQSLISHNV